MTDGYIEYRKNAIMQGLPPLTRREWENEGSLTLVQSKRKSAAYQEMISEQWFYEYAYRCEKHVHCGV